MNTHARRRCPSPRPHAPGTPLAAFAAAALAAWAPDAAGQISFAQAYDDDTPRAAGRDLAQAAGRDADTRDARVGSTSPSVIAGERPRFGLRDTHSITFTGGVAFSLEEDPSTDSFGSISYGRFIADDVELIGEFAVFYYNQLGDNAVGFNPTINFRWHFYNTDAWSVFIDTGIGVTVSTDVTPEGGTGFNFTPRAGGGFTRRLTDDGVRLVGGARWHHISNARIEGDDRNPDRDGIAVYMGLSFPL